MKQKNKKLATHGTLLQVIVIVIIKLKTNELLNLTAAYYNDGNPTCY